MNNGIYFFALLQGYTDAAYRNAHARNFRGIETYYTPFVRLEKGEVRTRDLWVTYCLKQSGYLCLSTDDCR